MKRRPSTQHFDLHGRINLRTFLSMQLFTYEIMSENIGLTDAKDCDACSLWKDVPLRNFLTYMDVSACTFSHSWTSLYTTCHIISFVCAVWHVSTQCGDYETSSCASSHTKRWVSPHFLTYEIVSMRKFKHMTSCLSRNFSQVQSKQSTTSRLFLTYERFSLWNFLLTRRLHVQIVS